MVGHSFAFSSAKLVTKNIIIEKPHKTYTGSESYAISPAINVSLIVDLAEERETERELYKRFFPSFPLNQEVSDVSDPGASQLDGRSSEPSETRG